MPASRQREGAADAAPPKMSVYHTSAWCALARTAVVGHGVIRSVINYNCGQQPAAGLESAISLNVPAATSAIALRAAACLPPVEKTGGAPMWHWFNG